MPRTSRTRVARLVPVVLLIPALVGFTPLSAAAAPVAAASGPVAAVSPRTDDLGLRSDRVRPRPGRQSWRTIDRIVSVTTGPDRDIDLDIDTRLYVPSNASRRHRQPAILMTHGFGGSKDSTEVVTTAQFFAAHGYHVLTYTSSGFGQSGGCITLQSADYDVPVAKQLVTKLLGRRKDVRRDRKGVRVGTIGGSYGGGIQLPLAAHDRRIRTSIVGRTWGYLGYSLDPNNRVAPGDPTGFTHTLNPQGVFKQEWTSLFYALGNSQPASGNGGCPEAKTASGDPVEIAAAGSCPGFYLPVCRIYELLSTTGETDEAGRALVRRSSASTFVRRLKRPVLFVQGQKDTLFNLNDASSTYRALRRRGVPVGMIWNSGGHGGWSSQPGECELYDGKDRTVAETSDCYLTLRSLGWMNRWVRGTKAGRGPGFTFYRPWATYDGSGANDEQYAKAPRFPLPRTTTRFTLSGSDELAEPGTSASAGSALFVNPPGGEPAAYSETSNFMGPDSSPSSGDVPPAEIEGQHVDFTTGPLRRQFMVAGVPSARLQISNANGQDMVFFAKVYDIAPDGGETLINRLIAPVRVPADAVGDPVRIKLPGFVHRFPRHHRIRLVLASTDQTSYNAKVADTLTVSTGAGSTFTLPGRWN